MSKTARVIAALALSVLVALFTALDAWLVAAGELGPGQMVALLAMELAAMLVVIWVATVNLERRVFGPLGRLQEQLSLLLGSDCDHRVQIEDGHLLGKLPVLIEELAEQLARERLETARTMSAATERIEHRKSRLEAILRDLHEGVVVCNDSHRIVLFNQAASASLEGAGPVGLHRPVTSLVPGGRIAEEYAGLRSEHKEDRGPPPVRRFKDVMADGRELDIRMGLVVEPHGRCSGYVLSFSGDESPSARGGQQRPVELLSDRPEFYDFSLLESRYDRDDSNRRLEELDYVVFDTETTGLNPSRGDAMVQICGVRLVTGRPTGEEFTTLVNPGMAIPLASIRFHGITDDMVADAPDVRQAVRSFSAFVQGAVLVAHNAAFDMKFLRMQEADSGVVFENAVLDTLLLSFVLQPEHDVHTLDAIAARFGVSISDEARHTAPGDARATAEIFLKMLPVLRRGGLETLGDALEASNRVLHVRRLQERF
jgi:DNA polymerase-3 subunit epsilon